MLALLASACAYPNYLSAATGRAVARDGATPTVMGQSRAS